MKNTASFNKIVQKKEIFKQFKNSIQGVKTKTGIEEEIQKTAKRYSLDNRLLKNFFKYKLFMSLYKKIKINNLINKSMEIIKKDCNVEGLILIESDLKKF